MRRALLVSPSAARGGSELAFASLAELLPAHGWEPVPVLLADGPLRERLGPRVRLLPAGRTRHLHRTAATVRALARLAREEEAEVVVSSQSKCHVYGGAAAALARVPAVWWQHGTPSRTRIELAAARVPAAAVVCVSEAAAARQRRLTPRRRVEALHPGTDLAAVRAARGSGRALRAELGWEDAPLVGIVGRLQDWKGQHLFLEAAARVAAAEPAARFAVVGGAILGREGDYAERLHRRARELGLGDRVRFTGHLDDVRPWLDALDVLVHASTFEPFGLVLVEALAAGAAVVTAATGGAREIVEDGVSGLVVERTDEALAGGVLRLLRDPTLAARLRLAGEERARLFGADDAAAAWASLLDELAERRALSAAATGAAR